MGWFKHLSKFMSNDFIKSDPMNDKLDRIAASFDYLPTPRESGEKGFLDPLVVGGATKSEHATTAGQAVNRSFNTGLDTGTANNYDITIPIAITSYTDGLEIWFKPVNNCTGASQVKVNGLGYVPVKKANGHDFYADDLTTSTYAGFRFNGTEFRAIGTLAGDADQAALSKQSADESKQWAIGVPTEPAEHSAKWWAEQAPNAETLGGYPLGQTGVPLIRGYQADGRASNYDLDLNGLEVNSVYNFYGSNTPNSPDSRWGFVTTYVHYNFSSTNAWRSQVSVGMQTHDIYHRYGNSDGSWNSWAKFITTDNFNTYGDARYLRLSGGSISGDLNVNGKFKTSGNDAVTYDTVNHHVIFGDTLRISRLRGTVVYLDSYQAIPRSIWYDGDIFTAQDDNICSLGFSSARWTKVFSVNGTIDTSDERLKDISDLGDTSWIYDLEPISYTWKDKPCGTRYGFGAQTTYRLMPDKTANLIDKPDKKEDPWGMQPDQLIPLLLNEMKIIRQRIEQLEAQ